MKKYILKIGVALCKLFNKCGNSNAWQECKELLNRLAHDKGVFFNKVKTVFRLFRKNKKFVKIVSVVLLFAIMDLSPLSAYIPDDIHDFVNHVGVPVITSFVA